MERARMLVRIGVVSVVIILIAVLAVPLLLRFSMLPFIYESVEKVPDAEAALVLGASVRRGIPSPVLADRADIAIKLYQKGKVKSILVTGDDSKGCCNEVTPVHNYLVAAGIPPEVIVLDHAGFDTFSSMYRAHAIFHANSVVIVTQDFHLPRSLYLARSLGINAVGIPADHSGVLPYNYLREIPASIKAVWDIYTHRIPKFLGPEVPLLQ